MNLTLKRFSNPILLISDNPSQETGLARQCRGLAHLLCTMPEFRVGVLARTPFGATSKRSFPWVTYPFPEQGQWGEEYVQRAWKDLAGEDQGIIMSLWDLSRMLWFAQPQRLREDLASFLGPYRTFTKWAYVPVDGTGPNENGLPIGMSEAAKGYDRVLAASEWGANVIRHHRPADWIPHGISTRIFDIGPRRGTLEWDKDLVVVGCNMANQARKDWPTAFECAKVLRDQYGNRFKFWANVDVMVGYWNLYALAADYGVSDCIEVSMDLTDEQLAQRYSACDCTILPTGGEGFGLPIAESLACGTACVTTDYAAGQELVGADCRVPAVAFKVDTAHDVRRAVLSGYGFARRAMHQIDLKRNDWDVRGRELRESAVHLGWEKIGVVWRRWFLEGIGL